MWISGGKCSVQGGLQILGLTSPLTPDYAFRLQFYGRLSHVFTEDAVNQRSPAFEKASLIFNYAALCSRLPCNRGYKSEGDLLDQVQWFVQAHANLQAQESLLARDMYEWGNGNKFKKPVKYIGGACRASYSTGWGFMDDVLKFSTNVTKLICNPQSNHCLHLFWEVMVVELEVVELEHLTKGYGKLASSAASTYDTQVTRAVPSYWMELLKVKSQYYYAQINHELAMVLLCLATNGKVLDSGRVELKPFSEDVFLEAEVAWQLSRWLSPQPVLPFMTAEV
ncbi:hypothetical protein TSMEX_002612 [Taenia solium]|eukprot:TsM_000948200 transcript=TsM_000948200 gene=TsM_000948200